MRFCEVTFVVLALLLIIGLFTAPTVLYAFPEQIANVST